MRKRLETGDGRLRCDAIGAEMPLACNRRRGCAAVLDLASRIVGDPNIQPAKRVDRQRVALVDHNSRRLRFDNSRSPQRMSYPEIVERVDVDVPPSAEIGLAPGARQASR